LKKFSALVFWQSQAIDLKGKFFCLAIGQIIETRMKYGLSHCQEAIVHKVIHKVCG
jgi:hypothetical protein